MYDRMRDMDVAADEKAGPVRLDSIARSHSISLWTRRSLDQEREDDVVRCIGKGKYLMRHAIVCGALRPPQPSTCFDNISATLDQRHPR